MNLRSQFRSLLSAPEILVMPGVHDALSARVAAEAGFSAITMGGFAATGSLLGQPDSSQLGLQELADHYARVVDASGLPLLADADTGFGNVTNVRRVVQAYERAGVAGLFIEDQVYPKRCGHTPGKAIVPIEDMLAKLKAALDARRDSELVIMARTDARAVEGLDAAIERANLFREAGADLLFFRISHQLPPGHHIAQLSRTSPPTSRRAPMGRRRADLRRQPGLQPRPAPPGSGARRDRGRDRRSTSSGATRSPR
jgi:2,3-dimethylmalate lyase